MDRELLWIEKKSKDRLKERKERKSIPKQSDVVQRVGGLRGIHTNDDVSSFHWIGGNTQSESRGATRCACVNVHRGVDTCQRVSAEKYIVLSCLFARVRGCM